MISARGPYSLTKLKSYLTATGRETFRAFFYLKSCVCQWKYVLIAEKDPFGVCNDRYTSAASVNFHLFEFSGKFKDFFKFRIFG